MKKLHNNIVGWVGVLAFCAMFLSCQKQDSPFDVSGECLIDSLVLDDVYPGVIDHASATVTVAVPTAVLLAYLTV